jgi:hypothetical protein
MLTDDVFNDVYGTFQRMFDIAVASAGPWAIINNALQQLRNAVAEGALPSLKGLAEFLLRFDITPFTTALSEATNTFLTPIIAKIKELLGDERGGLIGISEKLNAVAMIGGSFLAGVIEGFDQVMIKAAELIGNDAAGITGLASKLGEFAAWALVLAPTGAVVGMIVGGFGSIIRLVHGLTLALGGVATGGLLLAMAAMVADWDHWSSDVIPDLLTAIGDLAAELGFGGESGLTKFLQGVSWWVEVVVRGIETWIRVITTVIRKLKELAQWQATAQPQQSYMSYDQNVGQKQGGGYIPRTGRYLLHEGERVVTRHEANTHNWSPTFYITGSNANEIADEIERRLAQRSRSPYMVR